MQKDGATVPQNGQVSTEIWNILQKNPDKLQFKFGFDLPETESKPPATNKTKAKKAAKPAATGGSDQITPEQFSLGQSSINPEPKRKAWSRTQVEVAPTQTQGKVAADREDERNKTEPLVGPQDQRVILNSSLEWQKGISPDELRGMSQADTVHTGAIYDHENGKYWITTPEDAWIKASETAVKNHLHIDKEIPKSAPKDPTGRPTGPSPVDVAMNAIVRVANVDIATQLAGYSKGVYEFRGGRILVPKSPVVIEGKKGNWDFIRGFLTQFFAVTEESDEQLERILGWLSCARKSLVLGTFSPGQAQVIAGEHNCGKNAYLELIVTPLLGGRSANPFQYMVGQTAFNAELIKAEHLIISDQPPMTSYEDKVTFGARIKDFTVNREQRLHPKGRDAIIVVPFRRLSIALNDDPESRDILPPSDDAILEKMMLIKVERPDCLPKDNSLTSQKELAEKVRRDLPAFIYYLENEHQIRPEIACGRFGVKAYHNPIFLEDVIDSSPEGSLWDMLEQAGVTEKYDGSGEWEDDGNGGLSTTQKEVDAQGILKELKNHPETKEEASKFLKNSRHIGKLLSRLSKRPNTRIFKRSGRARSMYYSFRPPANVEEPF